MSTLHLVLEGAPQPHTARALSPNGRQFWAERHAATRVMAWHVWEALRGVALDGRWDGHPLAPPVVLRATFVLPQVRRRDQDNFTCILKPCVDSLVRLGVLVGDDTGSLWLEPVVLEVRPKERRLILDLESRADPAGAE